MKWNELLVLRFFLFFFGCGLGLSACSNLEEAVVSAPEREHRTAAPAKVSVSSEADIASLFDAIADRRFVLLGESTHGTHEYYRWRDLISRHLIREKGFRFVAVEGDWDAIFELNQYVKHRTPDELDLDTLLRGLDRWPHWMWANEEFAAFLAWVRQKNATRSEQERIGVYGMDMQNPQASMDAVVKWFEENDPDAASAVKARYRTVRGVPDGFRRYAQRLAQGGTRLTDDFAHVLERIREHHAEKPRDPLVFAAMMNAKVVVSAEAQHHAMVQRGPGSWNVRARFMNKAFRRLAERYGEDSRGIVWAHNTHVGDASATDMLQRGEVNIGQLLREDFGSGDVYILGFSTALGTVAAGTAWGAPMEIMDIFPPRKGSLEGILYARELDKILLFLDPDAERREWSERIPHRAIGVVYRPPHEAYVMTVPDRRYDAIFFIRETRALSALRQDGG